MGTKDEARLRHLVDILQHPSDSIQDFLDYALDQAIKLTESRIGYIYHYDEERREFVLNTWSKHVMDQCAVADPPTCYELDKTGFWGEAVRQRRPMVVNDFRAGHPLRKGYPQGHVELSRFMTVPVFKDGDIVGVVGLADKDGEYDETDILQVSLLMEAVWKVAGRKLAEQELRETKAVLHAALKAAKAGTWEWDLVSGENTWGDELWPLYGLERGSCSPSYESWLRSIHPEDRAATAAAVSAAAGRGEELNAEWRVDKGEGPERWLMSRGQPVLGENGAVARYLGVVIDITERKQAEKTLQAALGENRRLLDELQHRAKNSFNMILGMIGLTSGAGVSHETRGALEELGARVMSVSELYSMLYSSASFEELRLDNYCGRIAGALVAMSANVSLEAEMEALVAPAREAARIGLLVAELITNAIKYAFPGGRRGTIALFLARTARGMVLEVRDDGAGLPSGFDLAVDAGTGLTLVQGLAGEIDGTFRMEGCRAGTRCIVDLRGKAGAWTS